MNQQLVHHLLSAETKVMFDDPRQKKGKQIGKQLQGVKPKHPDLSHQRSEYQATTISSHNPPHVLHR